ncbi:unnamed protein product [Lathyrus oleraceus]|uniref:Dof zinc finger protein n=1 Tax=Pisum sativum TaxID=3888 RepID=A0A9D4XF84_PEA|nr:dof zinc finger protein DOF3.7-like [Pisum sativum]KAI5418185.1 hypothetical protein KIW84_042714 [Pisum sativum]
MIPELFGNGASASLIPSERNYSSINGGVGGGLLLQQTTTQPPSSSPCPSSTTTTPTTTSTPTTTPSSENQQSLRCPRCDSSNTKFCYYNNYNLTQPRHFCKTCRRYWTKGGALRNVPIGGGCRKNRNIGASNIPAKTTANKMKTVASEFMGRTSNQGFDLEHIVPPPSQILWGSPQNSHLLSLLRSNQNPNPNLVKEEGNNLIGSHVSHMMSSQPLVSSNGYDGIGHVLCNPFWRNNHDQTQQLQNGGFVLGEQHQQQQHQHQSSGIQELYQKLRSSTSSSSGNNYCSEISSSPTVLLGNVASNTSTISNILETTSVPGAELGYWNPIPTLTWSDLPTTNGAYIHNSNN